jgi:hypothetical protein
MLLAFVELVTGTRRTWKKSTFFRNFDGAVDIESAVRFLLVNLDNPANGLRG